MQLYIRTTVSVGNVLCAERTYCMCVRLNTQAIFSEAAPPTSLSCRSVMRWRLRVSRCALRITCALRLAFARVRVVKRRLHSNRWRFLSNACARNNARRDRTYDRIPRVIKVTYVQNRVYSCNRSNDISKPRRVALSSCTYWHLLHHTHKHKLNLAATTHVRPIRYCIMCLCDIKRRPLAPKLAQSQTPMSAALCPPPRTPPRPRRGSAWPSGALARRRRRYVPEGFVLQVSCLTMLRSNAWHP